METYPFKKYFISGCLAFRFDVPIPEGVARLENLRVDYQSLDDMSLVHYQSPFWVKNFDEKDAEHNDGHLFRRSYPLRIGVGCSMNCAYCTIHVTRGQLYKIDPSKAEDEFKNHDNIVLISDSPTLDQIMDWCSMATKYSKRISIRNVEPQVAVTAMPVLLNLADRGLLKEFHCPIQHTDLAALKDMRRNVNATTKFILSTMALRMRRVFLATNIIIDYKDFPNPDMEFLKDRFDYISWNPYWDGTFLREKAEERFAKYFPWTKEA